MAFYTKCQVTDAKTDLNGDVQVLYPLATGTGPHTRPTELVRPKNIYGDVAIGNPTDIRQQAMQVYTWIIYDNSTNGTLPAYADIFDGTLPSMARIHHDKRTRYKIIDGCTARIQKGGVTNDYASIRFDKDGGPVIRYKGDTNRYEDQTTALYLVTAVQSWTAANNTQARTGCTYSAVFHMTYN